MLRTMQIMVGGLACKIREFESSSKNLSGPFGYSCIICGVWSVEAEESTVIKRRQESLRQESRK